MRCLKSAPGRTEIQRWCSSDRTMWWFIVSVLAGYLITFIILEVDEKARELDRLQEEASASSCRCDPRTPERADVPATEAWAVETALTRIAQLVSNVPQQHERIVAEMQRAVDRRNAELMAERSRQLMECHKQLRAALVSQGDSPVKRQQGAVVSSPQSQMQQLQQKPTAGEVVFDQKLRP
ncbi:uncharacterized protein LOC126316859 [Schistocerca gregaria]|uniref:uncharacterized protein LOC126316859 n=1 Tax=Schistocerca gregaria TaxID=7010 RepID=UPI00211E30AD|nr:uncharacterized protein LOC126316859 [Schistocerca gregaria]